MRPQFLLLCSFPVFQLPSAMMMRSVFCFVAMSTALAMQPSQEGPITDFAEAGRKMAGKLSHAVHKSIDNMNAHLNKTVTKIHDSPEVKPGSNTSELAQGIGEIISKVAKTVQEHIDDEIA